MPTKEKWSPRGAFRRAIVRAMRARFLRFEIFTCGNFTNCGCSEGCLLHAILNSEGALLAGGQQSASRTGVINSGHDCGINRTYLSAVERSERNVSIDNIARIAKGLHVETWKLLRDE